MADSGSLGSDYSIGAFPVSLKPDSVVRLGEAHFQPVTPGAYELHAEMLDAKGRQISEKYFRIHGGKVTLAIGAVNG
jgi:hypothetical protein